MVYRTVKVPKVCFHRGNEDQTCSSSTWQAFIALMIADLAELVMCCVTHVYSSSRLGKWRRSGRIAPLLVVFVVQTLKMAQPKPQRRGKCAVDAYSVRRRLACLFHKARKSVGWPDCGWSG